MTAFVKSVQYVEITLTGSTAVSADLTKSQTFGDCVPFYTVNLVGILDTIEDRFVDVSFASGSPPTVIAQRTDAEGTVVVGIFVVEFDTSGNVDVEQGTFTIANTASSTTETITSVTTTRAFCVIAYSSTSAADDWDDGLVSVVFNSATELGFSRDTGTAGVNAGHYYVVKTSGTDFLVDHVSVAIGNTDETTEVTITSVATSKAFVYSTMNTAENGDDILRACIITDIKDATTIRIRRGFDAFADTPGSAISLGTVKAQIISIAGSEFAVQRDECDWGDSLTKAVTISPIDQTKAIVVSGGYQGHMSGNTASGPEVAGIYGILDFTSNTVMTGTRGTNGAVDGTTFFEVVEFALAGAAAIPTIHLTMAPYTPAVRLQ